MKLFRHLDLMMAVFLCTTMILAPVVSAVGTGQGMNQGIDQVQSGNIQANQGMNPGHGSGTAGNANPAQDNGQNNTGPGQDNPPGGIRNQTAGTGPQSGGPGNAAMFGNRTMNAPGAGNLTPPSDKPGWNFDNSTAMGGMNGQRPGFGNETMHPLPPDWNGDNSTFVGNQAWDGNGSGNVSMPAPHLQGNAANPGQQTDQNQQQSKDDLIVDLISWFKSYMSS